MAINLSQLKKDFKALANKDQAKNLARFFKTGPGEYGEGDIFLGIKVPEQRKLVGVYKNLDHVAIQELLHSKIHEHRLTAVLILVEQFNQADEANKKSIFDFYLKNTFFINNWDLVDLSAPKIVGEYLADKPRDILYRLVLSPNLWERRISILATFAFIKRHDFKDSLKIAEIFLSDKHDLIQKATGWMLREIGKRDQKVLEDFLEKNLKKMPRVTLRYAIERMEEKKRKRILSEPGLRRLK
jgi:3-methyladenine DNA glycosylase AlkD